MKKLRNSTISSRKNFTMTYTMLGGRKMSLKRLLNSLNSHLKNGKLNTNKNVLKLIH